MSPQSESRRPDLSAAKRRYRGQGEFAPYAMANGPKQETQMFNARYTFANWQPVLATIWP